MVKTLPKILSVLCAMVLLFVVNTRPLCVSAADTPDLTLVETELSASEVAELVAGEVAVGVILIIVGFIALTYVTLRNVDAPIQFNSTDSFFDKCQALGQYMLDNIDDNVKDVIYSVYEFVTAGSITSISSVPKLNLTTVGQFFGKIGAWLGGSLVNNVSTVANNFLDMFGNALSLNCTLNEYGYIDNFESVFNSYSGFTYDSTLGYFYYDVWDSYSKPHGIYYNFITISNTSFVDNSYFLVYSTTNELIVYICSFDGTTYTPYSVSMISGQFKLASGTTVNTSPNLSSYSSASYSSTSNSSFSITNGNSAYALDYSHILSYLASFGIGIGMISSTISGSVIVDDVDVISSPTVSSTSDTVTTPISDELVLEIANIAAAAAAGTIATTKDYYDELIAGLALTITSALSGSNFTMPEGDYYIPSLDNIWKYVEYMFSTLGSWIIFAGKCIQCVTVGEGGLSWIFYGGFIFLICGGIVGKILLG